MRFEWSDGWLLTSILYGGKGGFNLTSIITIGDMLNHAVFNREEIEDGLNRLVSAGLVVCAPPKYRATALASSLFKPIQAKRLTHFGTADALAKLLESTPYDPQMENDIQISEDEYESAVNRYLRR